MSVCFLLCSLLRKNDKISWQGYLLLCLRTRPLHSSVDEYEDRILEVLSQVEPHCYWLMKPLDCPVKILKTLFHIPFLEKNLHSFKSFLEIDLGYLKWTWSNHSVSKMSLFPRPLGILTKRDNISNELLVSSLIPTPCSLEISIRSESPCGKSFLATLSPTTKFYARVMEGYCLSEWYHSGNIAVKNFAIWYLHAEMLWKKKVSVIFQLMISKRVVRGQKFLNRSFSWIYIYVRIQLSNGRFRSSFLIWL